MSRAMARSWASTEHTVTTAPTSRAMAPAGVGAGNPRHLGGAGRGERGGSADQPGPGDADLHRAATGSVLPTARATSGTAAISARKLSNVSDWKPSESA